MLSERVACPAHWTGSVDFHKLLHLMPRLREPRGLRSHRKIGQNVAALLNKRMGRWPTVLRMTMGDHTLRGMRERLRRPHIVHLQVQLRRPRELRVVLDALSAASFPFLRSLGLACAGRLVWHRRHRLCCPLLCSLQLSCQQPAAAPRWSRLVLVGGTDIRALSLRIDAPISEQEHGPERVRLCEALPRFAAVERLTLENLAPTYCPALVAFVRGAARLRVVRIEATVLRLLVDLCLQQGLDEVLGTVVDADEQACANARRDDARLSILPLARV